MFDQDESNSRPVLARLEIARLGVFGLIEDGFDASTLGTGIGLLPQGAKPGEPGNMILAAHRDTYFSGLSDATPGDLIVVRAGSGREYDYIVRRTFAVAATDSSALRSKPGRNTLTLVTSYPFHSIGDAPARFVVQAELLDDIRQSNQPVI